MGDFLSAAAPRAVFERYLTRNEEKKLLAHIAKHTGHYARRDHAWIRLLRYTGLRLGSARGLTVGEAKGAIASGQLRAADQHAKGHHGYDISVSSKAALALRDLLKVRRGMGLPDDDDAPLICSRLGIGMAERSYQHNLHKWGAAAGLTVAASPHWLRHTLAKRVMDATEHRDPQAVVQVALGHRSRMSTTVYTLPDREEIRRSMEAACQ